MIDAETSPVEYPKGFLRCKCGSLSITSELIRYRGIRSQKVTCHGCGKAFHYQWRNGRVIEAVYLKGAPIDMQVASLNSSVLDTATFDDTREVIIVRFKNGSTYEYSTDPKADPLIDMRVLYLSFVHSDSAGKFFAQHIKGKLPFQKIEPQEDVK